MAASSPRRVLAAAAAAAALLAAVLGGTLKYSESPSFCRSCHIMEPYYAAWKSSPHNKVACVKCHYPPGSGTEILWHKFQAMSQVVKYVTRTYSSKPFAEIPDASCLRSGCHSSRLLEGRVRSKAGIKFDHRPHLTEVRRGRKLRCVSCHSQIVVGKHVEVTYDTCFLCHFKGKGEAAGLEPLGGCLGCHDLPEKTFQLGNMRYNHKDFVTQRGVSCKNCHLDIVRGRGEAPQDRCLTCHNQPEKLAKYVDIPFIHENHVTKHQVACFHCHQEIRHGLALSTGAAAAHTPQPAFECGYCHKGKHAGVLGMYTGKVASLGLRDMPSPMHLADVDCVGCHYDESASAKGAGLNGTTARPSEEACVKCHGPKFKGIWEETRAELKAALGRLSLKAGAVEAALKAASREAEDARQARRWLDFVAASHGEHNIYLAAAALRRTDAAFTRLAAGLKVPVEDLSDSPLVGGSYCATLCHPKVGVQVPPETVKTRRGRMPHRSHAERSGCAKCHEIGGHKKVPLRKDVKSVCAECHGG